MIERVAPADQATSLFAALQLIRHTLMHGGRILSVKDQLPFDERTAVNHLAILTWRALGLMFDGPDPRPDQPLNFGDPGNIVRRTIVGSANLTVRLSGDPVNPQLADLPNFKFTVSSMLVPTPSETAPSVK
jgi:hypothetical protein